MWRAWPSCAAAALLLAGCSGVVREECPAGLHRARTAELFFGRDTGAVETVSDADWRAFVAAEVTPRFPDGYTVSDAVGAWRGKSGTTVGERSKRLFIVLAGNAGEEARLEAIRAAFRRRFHQQSVMLLEGEGCVSF
jgi:hypothetical protein